MKHIELTNLKQEVKENVLAWGANFVGIASIDAFSDYESQNRPTFNFNIGTPKTVIVIGIHMVDPSLDLWLHPEAWAQDLRPSRSFADEILRGIAYRCSLVLEREYNYKTKPATYEPGLFLKEAAVLAGLGIIGRNNLLVTQQFGPRVRLRAIISEAPLESDPRPDWDPCRDCPGPCLTHCPVNALTPKYTRDKCLDYCLKTLRTIPDISSAAQLWCEECVLACPISQDL